MYVLTQKHIRTPKSLHFTKYNSLHRHMGCTHHTPSFIYTLTSFINLLKNTLILQFMCFTKSNTLGLHPCFRDTISALPSKNPRFPLYLSTIFVILMYTLCSDDAPFSKLKVTVAGSLKALLARQQKQKEEEEKTKETAGSPQEGTI